MEVINPNGVKVYDCRKELSQSGPLDREFTL